MRPTAAGLAPDQLESPSLRPPIRARSPLLLERLRPPAPAPAAPAAPAPADEGAGIPRHWFGGNPVSTALVNGVNLLFPAGERFFVRSVRHYIDRVPSALREDILGFFGQEGRHAQAHDRVNAILNAQGYDVTGFLRVFERLCFGVIEPLAPPALRLSVTAAAEHFTAIMAEGALGTPMLETAHPAMADLLRWHAAEEIEHKAVAFDVLQQVAPQYRVRVAGMAIAALLLGVFWLGGTTLLLAQDRRRFGTRLLPALQRLRALRQARGDKGIIRNVFVHGIRGYLRRDFHPNQIDNYRLAADYLASQGLAATRAQA